MKESFWKNIEMTKKVFLSNSKKICIIFNNSDKRKSIKIISKK
jgi:hypothetical protein